MNKLHCELIISYADHDMKANAVNAEFGKCRNYAGFHFDQIYDETGLDPRCFYDLIELVQMATKQMKKYGKTK